MYLKILPFNKALFKKDWKITRWLTYIMIIILLFSVTLRISSYYDDYKYNSLNKEELINQTKQQISYILIYFEDRLAIPIIIFPIALTAILFGEEKRRKTFETLAVMPYTKYEIYFNKLLLSIISVILPIVINGIIMLAMLGFNKELRNFYSTIDVLKWAWINFYTIIPFLGFSFLFATLTGTTLSQIILTGIFLVFPIGFWYLLRFNFWKWGVSDVYIYKYEVFFEKICLLSAFDGGLSPIYLIIISIGMFVVSKILFDKNKMERNGETLEFEGIETFFKVGVSICTMLLMGIIFDGVINNGYEDKSKMWLVFGYIVGIFVGWIASSYSIKFNRPKA